MKPESSFLMINFRGLFNTEKCKYNESQKILRNIVDVDTNFIRHQPKENNFK